MINIDDLPILEPEANSHKKINSQAIKIWVSDEYFYIEPNYRKSLIPTILKINRRSQLIRQIKREEFEPESTFVPHFFSFFIGIVNLNGKKMLFLTQEAQLVCTMNYRNIFKVTKPIFLFLKPEDKHQLSEKEAKVLINLVIIYEEGMYFSYSYNLNEPLHTTQQRKNFHSEFNWAYKFQQELQHFDKMWSLPLIQGFVGKIQMHIQAKKIKIILISRRKRYGSGTQEYTTGLNEEGYAGNFVQTQQILSINDYLFSFVQVRGSVPIFWKQIFSYGILNDFKIQRSQEQNQIYFDQHIDEIKKRRNYENVILLNLLCHENYEKVLIQRYEHLVKNNERTDLFYAYFDMHKECEGKLFGKFNGFINSELKTVIKCCSFTVIQEEVERKKFRVLHTQNSIIRSNCLYCIDRTNIAQSRIAAFHILEVFNHLDIKIDNFNEDLDFIEGDNAFGKLYRNLWADNGDYLSQQYMGTESTESYTIRKGKLSYLASIDHGMTSIERAFRNIRHEDEYKHKTLQFITK